VCQAIPKAEEDGSGNREAVIEAFRWPFVRSVAFERGDQQEILAPHPSATSIGASPLTVGRSPILQLGAGRD
jgi:hypothetical protein